MNNNLKAFNAVANLPKNKQEYIDDFFKDFLVYEMGNINNNKFCKNKKDCQKFIIENGFNNWQENIVLSIEKDYMNIVFNISGNEVLHDFNSIFFSIKDYVIQNVAKEQDIDDIFESILKKENYNHDLVANFCYHVLINNYDYMKSSNDTMRMRLYNPKHIVYIDEIMLKKNIVHNTVEFTLKEFWKLNVSELINKEEYEIGYFYKMNEDEMALLEMNGVIGA